MDFHSILSLGKEFLVLLIVFAALLAYAIIRGKRALMSLILGLYGALLISLKFPYYDAIYNHTAREGKTVSIITIVIFALFTVLGTILFERLLFDDYEGSKFEGLPKKVILAILGTILVLAFSYHVLPVTTLVNPGSAISTIFSPPQYFFWFLVIPLIGLFFI